VISKEMLSKDSYGSTPKIIAVGTKVVSSNKDKDKDKDKYIFFYQATLLSRPEGGKGRLWRLRRRKEQFSLLGSFVIYNSSGSRIL
ncbi:MAG: hypothetical protein IJN53_07865, partial [Oscillospiraceae bacterium]|nr:hypothetical protein [Oscillospiraceae bacterium]